MAANASPPAPDAHRGPHERFVHVLAAAVGAGLAVGVVIGGIGGRIAMRVLAVTSDDSLRGAVTDDEEVVGRVSVGGTVGLVVFCALLGVALALVYLVLRRWLPARRAARAAALGALLWAVAGAAMFDPDSFDFTALGPRWLAVAMFSALLAGAGAAVPLVVDAAVDRWPVPSARAVVFYVPLLPLLLVPPVIVLLAVAGLVAWTVDRRPWARRAWESRATTVVGLGVLAGLGLWLGVVAAGRAVDIVG